MARKKSESKMTTEERIEQVKLEISKTQEMLSSLKQKEKDLNDQKKKEDLDNLVKTMETANLSIKEVQLLIEKSKSKLIENDKTTVSKVV